MSRRFAAGVAFVLVLPTAFAARAQVEEQANVEEQTDADAPAAGDAPANVDAGTDTTTNASDAATDAGTDLATDATTDAGSDADAGYHADISSGSGRYGGKPEFGFLDPGNGFDVAVTKYGSLNISGYILARYLNQLPASQSFTDHLGREHEIDTRQDINIHRIMIWLSGFMLTERLRYVTTFWTVLATTQVAIIANLSYDFHKALRLFVGVAGLPGTRSLQGTSPYFFGTDRQLADEFFRPGFTSGLWITGEPLPRFFYNAMIGNNLSQLGITSAQLTRDFATSASLWVLPTTGEFGPRGYFGDYEFHEKPATRIGTSFTHSREDRFTQLTNPSPDNTQIRLSDSLLLFETGALAPNVTVEKADYWLGAADLGLKYRGLHFQAEYYMRWLNNLNANGPLPISTIFDHGFYAQAAYFAIPKRLELYESNSFIFGQWGDSWEVAGGANIYPFDSRSLRINPVVNYVDRSAASSLFGYYVGGQRGTTISLAASLFF